MNKKFNEFIFKNRRGELDWRKFIVSVILLGLFMFIIFAMFNSFSNENNSINVLSDSNFSGLNSSIYNQLNQAQQQATNVSNSFKDESSGDAILTQFGFYFRSIIAAGTTFLSFGLEIPTLMINSISNILGISSIVTGTLIGILIISMILLIWAMLRTGK